jgi:hypothetical protein
MEYFKKIEKVNPKTRTVTVEGGVTYGELCIVLDEQGSNSFLLLFFQESDLWMLAMRCTIWLRCHISLSLARVPQQHMDLVRSPLDFIPFSIFNIGDKHQNLAGAVNSLEIVDGTGKLHHIIRPDHIPDNKHKYWGAVVHLGKYSFAFLL